MTGDDRHRPMMKGYRLAPISVHSMAFAVIYLTFTIQYTQDHTHIAPPLTYRLKAQTKCEQTHSHLGLPNPSPS